MQYQKDVIHLLMQLGFTETQAKIYLTLIYSGETDAKILAKESNTANQVTYRTLDELLAKGIVEKKLSIPNRYQAIPLEEAIELVLNTKAEEYASALEKTRQILLYFNKEKSVDPKNPDYSIKIVEGKETIIKKCRSAHANTVFSVVVCSTFQRWIQVGREIHETIENGLARGVEYKIVVEKPEGEFSLPQEVKILTENKNFQLKICDEKLRVNAVIFDDKICSFSLYPSKSVAESPMIWTNHTSIIAGFQEYFKKMWKTAKKYSNNKNSATELTEHS